MAAVTRHAGTLYCLCYMRRLHSRPQKHCSVVESFPLRRERERPRWQSVHTILFSRNVRDGGERSMLYGVHAPRFFILSHRQPASLQPPDESTRGAEAQKAHHLPLHYTLYTKLTPAAPSAPCSQSPYIFRDHKLLLIVFSSLRKYVVNVRSCSSLPLLARLHAVSFTVNRELTSPWRQR